MRNSTMPLDTAKATSSLNTNHVAAAAPMAGTNAPAAAYFMPRLCARARRVSTGIGD